MGPDRGDIVDLTQSEEQQVAEILHDLKGHPDFVIANRIIDELRQRRKQRDRVVTMPGAVTVN
jgi:hypothetical protein